MSSRGNVRSCLRRLAGLAVGLVFFLTIFVFQPRVAVQLNEMLGWPEWKTAGGRLLALPLFVGGVGIVLYSSGLFAIVGRGSPVPIDPPKDLVISGLYRYSRNPIYVAYGMILLSYFLYWGQLTLLIYAAIVPAIFAVWVILVEEPGLRRRFGKRYEDYTRQVPRWFGLSPFRSRAK